MLLKISLGLAILVGLATLYVTHFQVGGKISALNEDVAAKETEIQSLRESEGKLKSDLKTLRSQYDDASKALTQATNEVREFREQAIAQKARADKASADLLAAQNERNQAQNELAQWKLFEMTPEQIRNNLARLRNVEREREVFAAENQALTRKVSSLQRELARYTGGLEPEPDLPPGLRGNVIAVDPKYDFVVLNVGGNQGIVKDGRLLVSRDGKLIGQVKVISVEADRSIANVLPEWKQGDEIMEGDLVIAKHRL